MLIIIHANKLVKLNARIINKNIYVAGRFLNIQQSRFNIIGIANITRKIRRFIARGIIFVWQRPRDGKYARALADKCRNDGSANSLGAARYHGNLALQKLARTHMFAFSSLHHTHRLTARLIILD